MAEGQTSSFVKVDELNVQVSSAGGRKPIKSRVLDKYRLRRLKSWDGGISVLAKILYLAKKS